ncbi:MAG: hypothetical protein ACK5JH_08830 [Anaerocolumna sp.]
MIMRASDLLVMIYGKSPVFIQNIGITIYGIKIFLERYTGKYKQYYKFYNGRVHKSKKMEEEIQNRKFLKILYYAKENSPFYRDFYKNIDLTKIKTVKDINVLPILSKEILKQNYDRIFTIKKREGLTFYTGGTTGTPISVRKRRIDVQKRMAYLDAYKQNFGFINNRMPSARFFGKNIIPYPPKNSIYWRKNYIAKQRLYSTYYLQDENLIHYIQDLNRFKPVAIDGFPSAIYTVAKYILDHNIELSFKPKAVFTTSETLLPIYRYTIEKAFHCTVSDQYASNEGAPFIIQCEFGGYHEAIDTGVFEHIPTEFGVKLLVTGFDTYGTPLIRYDIGDLIRMADNKTCRCKSKHPLIGGVIGRDSNYLVCKSKGRISLSQLSVIISELPGAINEMQFLQKTRDTIHVKVVLNDLNVQDKIIELIKQKLISYLGEDMYFLIDITKTIERTQSGKFQLIINQMEDNKE